MSTPFDVVNRILPHIKALIAWDLIKKGLGQRRVARALGTSQALISKYISRAPQYYLDELDRLGIRDEELRSMIEVVSNYIVSGRIDDSRSYLTVYIFTLLRSGKLCKAHRLVSKGLDSCRVCEYMMVGLEDEVVARVKYAVKVIESIPDIELIVPEIGMNVVEAKPNAQSVYEVVGIPGRIIKVNDRVRAVSQPTYGGSRFMASLILKVMKYFPNTRSAINIRYLALLEDMLKGASLRVTRVGPYESRSLNTVLELIERNLSVSPNVPDAIVDVGPPGFEHLIYVLAEDSVKLADKISMLMNYLRGLCSKSKCH